MKPGKTRTSGPMLRALLKEHMVGDIVVASLARIEAAIVATAAKNTSNDRAFADLKWEVAALAEGCEELEPRSDAIRKSDVEDALAEVRKFH